MILRRFIIHNLFSYRGRCEFNLEPLMDGRNVLLIWGRNGYGKTSFLNSLKLLLTGVSEELRRGVQSGRILKRDHYLLGMGDEWVGIFNCQARAAGETAFGVELEWSETAGTVKVERSWSLESGDVEEVLRVTPSFGDAIEDREGDSGGEARSFIQCRLPEAVMPFFVYDGERVQQLAEANREGQMEQIEQLLDLADIDAVNEYLGRNLATWRRESKDASQHEINALKLEIQSLEERLAGMSARQKELEEEVAETAFAAKRLDAALQSRRQFALQSEELQLTAKQEVVAGRLEERTTAFFAAFSREAPLAVLPPLLGMAAQELEKIATHPNRRLRDELVSIFSSLPERLFSDPPLPVPALNREQEQFLRRKLARVLDSYQPEPEDMAAGLFHLSPMKAEAVLKVVEDYRHDERKRSQWGEALLDIRRLKVELREIDRRRNDVSNLAPQERQLFDERMAERAGLDAKRIEIEKQNAILGEQKTVLIRELNAKQDQLRGLEKKLVEAMAARGRLSIGQRLQNALESYRVLLKAKRREDIEAAINIRFSELMTSHSQIRRIQVNEDFSLHYLDANQEPVGMGNISAGMKQLVAQALLWGLKDVSGREAPVVVDTPLARIDRQHQENLLARYYPKAGSQVIVLPTDSELDREKYALIKPHVYREYRLMNLEGDHTRVEEGGYY